ncbi:hypothetical protein Pve01_34260 [Planomonospora venezuelensis]|nr:hypothetical protein Pve01_34260 [Planomonospora venezuelensis]
MALWAAALAAASAPDLYFWVGALLSGDGGERVFAWMSSGWCAGYEINREVRGVLGLLRGLPLFWYGFAPLVVVAFAGWLLSTRAGRPRLGRTIGLAAAGTMLVVSLPAPALLTVDAALDRDCLSVWGPPELVNRILLDGFCTLVPAVLTALAARPPARTRPVRRGRPARAAVTVAVVAALLLAAAGDGRPDRVSDSGDLDCAGFGDVRVPAMSEREKAFLCRVRSDGFGADGPGVPQLAGMPDRALIAYGRNLCHAATRHGGDTGAKAVQQMMGEAAGGPLTGALAEMCPAVDRVLQAEGERRQAEEKAFYAAAENACAAHPRHRPRIRPVRQARATMWTEFWTIHAWDEGREGEEASDRVADLVGGGDGVLEVWAADEIGHACVTGEAYTRRPPVETRGWEQVVEVGYTTGTGALVLVDGNGDELPDLAAGGAGRYRVRVHVRGRKAAREHIDVPDGTVQLLVMVFPGEERKPVIYR